MLTQLPPVFFCNNLSSFFFVVCGSVVQKEMRENVLERKDVVGQEGRSEDGSSSSSSSRQAVVPRGESDVQAVFGPLSTIGSIKSSSSSSSSSSSTYFQYIATEETHVLAMDVVIKIMTMNVTSLL